MAESYEAVIGLEVHCQLQTESKAFSPESARFGGAPNTRVDPVSLGHPGTLPVLNEHVVAFALRIGLATDCRIAPRSVLARKHYFYPDLPKGYQISQYETPICSGGRVVIRKEHGEPRAIGLTRIHIEEDAGKSIHDRDPEASLLDYNRCGVPLIEIVSEPEIRSAREAYLYLRKIRQMVRYLRICDGNMEEGSLRCDANVSIRLVGAVELGTKTEVKNMNSFRNVERAIDYEITRQKQLLESGGRVVQETLLWDADRSRTRSMRSKEEAHDYRYFPDPDLCPIVVTDQMLADTRRDLPELPDARYARYVNELGLPEYNALVITEERDTSDYFEQTLQALDGSAARPKAALLLSNVVMTHVLRVVNTRKTDVSACPVGPGRLAALVDLRLEELISSTALQELFDVMIHDPRDPGEIASERRLLQESRVGALEPFVDDVLQANAMHVEQYAAGKKGLIGFFIGQVMRAYPGSPDPKLVRKLLSDRLETRRTDPTSE
jgi:aspartyl-tRNA(Asn)/glutamyl-tRNA(Gln) amidotransferase subunit B